jgi:surfactin synthase thioesterase subunit
MELALPVLRSDFELCERYSFRSEPPLGCPITAFGGTEDVDVSRADLEAWHQQTSSTLSVRMVAGDHFFIHAFEDWLIDQVTRSLLAAPSMLAPLAPA